MILNVCPSGVASAPPQRVWEVLTTPQRFGEWMDAKVLTIHPPGAAQAGQRIELVAPSFGRRWPVSIDVEAVDPQHRWLELTARTPFGVVNHERVTLTEVDSGHTLIRFN
jgi:uncharacterized protein YndB with AHSA1/START domain